ncbi:hypothetical protein T190_28910 [Sinorhizobium meliloti CCBAU 01290]|nr:hypothetical protein T190_28910 [Sinorhizobium meliloti CCBAU 01290]
MRTNEAAMHSFNVAGIMILLAMAIFALAWLAV